jgi:hypothetical protein
MMRGGGRWRRDARVESMDGITGALIGIALGLYARHKSLQWRVDRPVIA